MKALILARHPEEYITLLKDYECTRIYGKGSIGKNGLYEPLKSIDQPFDGVIDNGTTEWLPSLRTLAEGFDLIVWTHDMSKQVLIELITTKIKVVIAKGYDDGTFSHWEKVLNVTIESTEIEL